MNRHYLIVVFVALMASCPDASAQTFTTNRTPVGMEHNLLFYGDQRYAVTQTGSALLHLPTLFDGRFLPSYTATAPTTANPTVFLVEDLPGFHVQQGAWVGWSTRWWPPLRFKVEGYDVYAGANVWRVVADYSNQDFAGYSFTASMPSGSFTKLRFTIYSASGSAGRLGLSELFYIHPEATAPYEGLSAWTRSGVAIHSSGKKVGVNTSTPQNELDVNGTIRAKEVIVESGWADYVFDEGYELMPLDAVEAHIREHRRLPGVPTAEEVAESGVSLAESQRLLLEKVEELTLHVIEQNSELKVLRDQNDEEVKALLRRIEALESDQ